MSYILVSRLQCHKFLRAYLDMVWCARLSGIHENPLHSTLAFSPSIHPCAGNVDQSLAYCYAVLLPELYHSICATRGVITPPMRLGDKFEAKASE
ncbi:unnamed protein product [Protopolystoma xenopodis]|uniref:Uncharacterized protein n=1 Tax=Protopolystoma xenopodis TaxID=117903 RepID=A0A3S5A618_9PLAT|nr:unnamed protein product [Protopolystoma xenopodis]